MNFKKFKRLLSVTLSAAMVLSTNITGFAAEPIANQEAHEHDWQLEATIKAPAADEAGWGTYVCECGESQEGAIEPTAAIAEDPCTHESTETINRTEPTCWKDGNLTYYKCSNTSCGKYSFTTSFNATYSTEAEIKTAARIPKKDHNGSYQPAVAAECGKEGWKECYYCENCGYAYDTMDELVAAVGKNEDGSDKEEDTTHKKRNDYKLPALTHDYSETDTKKPYTVNWDSIEAPNFIYQENSDNGVTVERTCNNCGEKEQPTSIVVTQSIPDNANCKTGFDITYSLTATFGEKTDPGTSDTKATADTYTAIFKKTIAADTEHTMNYVFDWSAFAPKADKNGKLVYNDAAAGTVSAKRTCTVCKSAQEVPADRVTVERPENYPGTEPIDVSCTEDVEMTFSAKAFFDTEGEDGETVTDETGVSSSSVNQNVTKTITKAAHRLNYVAGTAASCDAGGNIPHFTCSYCNKKFSDSSASAPMTEGAETLPKLGHNFGIPVISWVDENVSTAKAVFTCTRGCGAVITRQIGADSIEKHQNVTDDTPCGTEINTTYKATVLFDKDAVKKSGDAYVYNEDEATNAIPYTKTDLVKTQEEKTVVQHVLIVTPSWVDTTGTDAYSADPGAGVSVALECTKCKGTHTLDNAPSGTPSAVESTLATDIVAAESNVTHTLDTTNTGNVAKTCTTNGKEIYKINVTVKCTVTAGTENTPYSYTLEYGKDASAPLTLETTTKAPGHGYKVLSLAWPAEETPDARAEGDTTSVTVKATLECQNTFHTGDNSVVLTGEDDGVVATVSTNVDLGYKAAKCTKPGMDVWTVAVTHESKNVPPKTEEAGYIQKEHAKLGHDYNTVVWDWSAFGKVGSDGALTEITNPNGKVYATYTCKRTTECNLAADEGETGEITDDHKWMKKVEATVAPVVGENVTCGDDLSYKATVGTGATAEADTKSVTGATLAHDWSDTITWGEWTLVTGKTMDAADATASTEEGAEPATVKVPLYSITATRTCNRNCGADGNPTTETIQSYSADGNLSTENYVKVTATATSKKTCTASGRTTYAATAVFSNGEDADPTEIPKAGVPFIATDRATGHKYEVTWDWKGVDAEGEETTVTDDIAAYTSVTATKACTNERCDRQPLTQTVNKGDQNWEDEVTSELTCTTPAIATYTATVDFNDGSGELYSDNNQITKNALGHNYKPDFKWEQVTDTEGKISYKATLMEICQNNNTETKPYDDEVAVKVTKGAYTAPTCVKEGQQLWTAEATPPGTSTPVTGSHAQKLDIDSTAHSFTDVTVDWTKLAEQKITAEDGTVTYTYSAPASRTCQNKDAENTACTQKEDIPVTITLTSDSIRPTCTTDGKLTYRAEITDNNDNLVLTNATEDKGTVPATGHKLERVPGKEGASCTDPAYPTHYHCSICGKNYTSFAADEEIIIAQAQGHIYGTPKFVWRDKEQKEAQAVFECTRTNCPKDAEGHTRVFAAIVDKDQKPYTEGKQTCSTTATAYYSAKVDLSSLTPEELIGFGKESYSGEVEALELPILPHNLDAEGKCEWCEKTFTKVVFATANTVIDTRFYAPDAAAITDELPTAPNRTGFTFKDWSLGDNTYTSEQKDELKAAIAGLLSKGGTITVTANYEAVKTTGTIEVAYVGVTKANDKYENIAIGSNYKVDAAATIGAGTDMRYFSHWSDKADGSSVLGTGTSYEVYIQDSAIRTVYAVYVADQDDIVQEAPTIAMTNKYASVVDGVNKVSFTATMSVPDAYTVLDSGILYGTSTAVFVTNVADQPITLEHPEIGTKIIVKALNGVKTNTLSIKVGTRVDKPVYAVGYLRYQDKNGEIKTIYTDVDSAVFNDLNK